MGTGEPRQASRQSACQILCDRGVELLELVKAQLERGGDRDQLVGGIVLTGGGSMLGGMLELAEKTLELPVRQGLPYGVQGLTEELSHPVYATAIGLALLGAQDSGDRNKQPGKAGSRRFVNRFLSWIGS